MMCFPTDVPKGYWDLALVGLNLSSWQPLAHFADTGEHAGSTESGFSVKCNDAHVLWWDLQMGGKYLGKICRSLCSNLSSSH